MQFFHALPRAALLAIGALTVSACGSEPAAPSKPGNTQTFGGSIATPPAGTAGTGGSGVQTPVSPSGIAGRGTGVAGGGTPITGATAGRSGTAGAGAAGVASTAAGASAAAGSGSAGTSAAAGSGTAGGGSAGTMAAAGSGAAGSTGAAGGGSTGDGMCCADGNCYCHGDVVSDLTFKQGTYKTANFRISTGTVYYPTDAEPPLAAIAIVPGFTNTGPEMTDWGPFYASWGIVCVVTNTSGADQPATRATKLLNSLKALKEENTKSGSALNGKLGDRFGTSGYSMGGGGTTIASGRDSTLKSSVGLAAWGGSGSNVKTPTLLLCGSADTVAACSMSSSVYRGITGDTPKMQLTISGASHFSWFGPRDGERGKSGMTALAFNKYYLEGDERWKPILLMAGGMTTIK